MGSRIFINGRLLRPNMAGVTRYTLEVIKRLEGKLDLLTPGNRMRFGYGVPWEQICLPTRIKRGDLLWSPANTGPMIVKNQVITIHDLIPLDHPEWFKPRFAAWHRILMPALARRARRLITDSEYSKARILKRFGLPEALVHVIPLGVGGEFKPIAAGHIKEVNQRYGLEGPYLLVVGSLEPRKNLAKLFSAWQLINRKKLSAELAVAGITGGNFRNTGYETVPPGVRFLGYVSDDDLPALYSGAFGLVFPSIYEGFGLPALEAMACGTPVAASNATSLPEVVGDAGLLFDPFSVDEMASVLDRVLEDDALRLELRQRGLERACQFTWEVTAHKTWQVLCQAQAELG